VTTAEHLDIGLVERRGLSGTGPWLGLNNRYVSGPERLSHDAQILLLFVMTNYRSGQVPPRAKIYEDQKIEAQELGQRYLSDKRIKVALAELKERGFYGMRKVSAGPNRWVNLRSFSNLPFEHVTALNAVPREQIINQYFPGCAPAATVAVATPVSAEPGEHDQGADHDRPDADREEPDQPDHGEGPRQRGRQRPVGNIRPVHSHHPDRPDQLELPGLRRPPRGDPRRQRV
jgi:hypothetical protein